MRADKIITIEVVNGVEGPSLYINDFRIVGNKPWGGGRIFHSWSISMDQLRKYLHWAGILTEKEARVRVKEKEVGGE